MRLTNLRRLLTPVLLGTCALGLALPAAARAQGDEELPENHISNDPYTEGDPELVRAAGYFATGGFEFAASDTAAIDARYPKERIIWLETAHFQLGCALPEQAIKRGEKKSVQRELDGLRERLPTIPKSVRKLDPWLVAHLYADRLERLYARVQGLLGVDDSMFPERPLETFNMNEKFMGMGPYLGQRGKYEVLLLPKSLPEHFCREEFGKLITDASLRWNVMDRDTLIAIVSGEALDSSSPRALYGHLAYNVAINLLDGYKHYNYDIPVWLKTGLGHLIEREVTWEHNTFDMNEDGERQVLPGGEWTKEALKLARKNDLPLMAGLVAAQDFGDLDLAGHVAAWAYTRFLTETNPTGYAAYLDHLTGLLNEHHIPDGEGMFGHARDAAKEHLGMNYLMLDEAFLAWLQAAEPLVDPVKLDD
jgi:hypothetical protein